MEPGAAGRTQAQAQKNTLKGKNMNYKLRIKHPSGAEFEAEGPAEFIQTEKEVFLKGLTTAATMAGKAQEPGAGGAEPDWTALGELRDGLTILRNKHPGLRAGAAALLILAAGYRLGAGREMSAIALSKAVKISGYAPERLDRALTKALREGLIRASGTKRSRAYEVTDRGLEMAWLEARKLTKDR